MDNLIYSNILLSNIYIYIYYLYVHIIIFINKFFILIERYPKKEKEKRKNTLDIPIEIREL